MTMSGLGVQVKVLEIFYVVACSLGSGCGRYKFQISGHDLGHVGTDQDEMWNGLVRIKDETTQQKVTMRFLFAGKRT